MVQATNGSEAAEAFISSAIITCSRDPPFNKLYRADTKPARDTQKTQSIRHPSRSQTITCRREQQGQHSECRCERKHNNSDFPTK